MKRKTVIRYALAAAILALVFAGCAQKPDVQEPTAPVQQLPTEATEPVTEAPTEEPTDPPTEPPTDPPTEPEVVVPEELALMLENRGLTVEALSERECTQLITVASSGKYCQLRYYYYENYAWICNEELSCSGFVGRNGASDNKREGDGKTPAGLFGVSDAFYMYDAPETGLDMFEITRDTYWVDDPDSRYYNTRVEGTENKDWDSAEHMIDYNPAYLYGFVIDYNPEAVYNMGSAIFFHVSTGGGTAGCVSTGQHYVLQYLALLDKNCNPQILIDG